MAAVVLFLVVIANGAQSTSAQVEPPYVPQRVFDTRARTFTDFETMLADLARANVVFVGEQHDDPNTHRLESALLQGLLRRKATVTVSMEMFERDVQSSLDGYLAGSLSEEDFLKAARPWPRYASDYRPLIELARTNGWSVVAANVPRRHAADVAKAGAMALAKLVPEERAFAARELECPFDAYYDRFARTMDEHPVPGADKLSADERRATTERYYISQCGKDETMAESIAAAFERRADTAGAIVHFTGAFHSDFYTGAAERTRRRLPGSRIVVVSMLPVENLDTLAPAGDDLLRADYLIYTVKR
jgi:uncharacterized iron-regulated protein